VPAPGAGAAAPAGGPRHGAPGPTGAAAPAGGGPARPAAGGDRARGTGAGAGRGGARGTAGARRLPGTVRGGGARRGQAGTGRGWFRPARAARDRGGASGPGAGVHRRRWRVRHRDARRGASMVAPLRGGGGDRGPGSPLVTGIFPGNWDLAGWQGTAPPLQRRRHRASPRVTKRAPLVSPPSVSYGPDAARLTWLVARGCPVAAPGARRTGVRNSFLRRSGV